MNRNWWQKKWPHQIYPRSFSDSNNDGMVIYKALFKNGLLRKFRNYADLAESMYPSPMADNGYDISDYYGISSDFGTMADFDELIEEAKRNIKVILDLVVNHTSDEHAWFQDVLKILKVVFETFIL